MKIRFSKFAKEDYGTAKEYYKKESISLSIRFINDVKSSINRILEFPLLYPKIDDKIQKCVVSKFPFTIFYTVKNDIIYILAVANHYRNLDIHKIDYTRKNR
ncbi:MAG: type II toxin-antitoxin system RelE/ParE family toxin [Campylobacterota bacterium]|nr:type II toxin-antitoxin system RelE/ParE family toxin [Campylobacterota bacterium]